jgi:ankyrin repeat protein
MVSAGHPMKAEACVKKLLEFVSGRPPKEKAAFLNSKDAEGATALYLAATHRNIKAVEVLLLAGSKLDIKYVYYGF